MQNTKIFKSPFASVYHHSGASVRARALSTTQP